MLTPCLPCTASSACGRAVLLAGPQPRVVLGHGCASWLLEHFRDVDTSASMAQRALQVRTDAPWQC